MTNEESPRKIYYSGSVSNNREEITDHLRQYGSIINENLRATNSQGEFNEKMGLIFQADLVVFDITGNPAEEMYLIRTTENGGKLLLCMYQDKSEPNNFIKSHNGIHIRSYVSTTDAKKTIDDFISNPPILHHHSSL